MTHEYVVAVGGHVGSLGPTDSGAPATAIAWAADRVLAVGSDDAARAISRGDSTFLDLAGCTVTALPDDLESAVNLARSQQPDGSTADITHRLTEAGLLSPGAVLEIGAPADLAFWDSEGRLVAVASSGVFRDGEPKRGPFGTASPR